MNLPVLRYTFAANALRLVVVAAGLILMGVIMPVVYAAFGQEMQQFIESVPFFSQMASNFGGGDVMSLNGSLAVAFTHPFSLLLMGIIAIVFPALAIAGERDKGTLEVTLSRPISRRGLLATLYLCGAVFIALLLGVLVATTGLVGYIVGFGDEIAYDHLLQLWLADTLFFTATMSLAFAVSVGADRAAPAIGVPAAVVLLSYLAWAIGGIWPDVKFLADWSPFHLLKAREVLADGVLLADLAVLVGLVVLFAGVAFYRFPRRDLPAPA
jgi:ABC-2 type transport system permease protein